MQRKNHVKMHSYPGMVAVVGVYHDSHVNFMAAGWHSYLSMEPPMYGIAIGRQRHTYGMMEKARKYTINFLPYEEASFIQYSGTVSGSVVDKNNTFFQGWTLNENGYSLLDDAYLVYECDLEKIVPTGDHDWIIGNISGCHYDEKDFRSDGLPDFQKLHIPLYLGRSSYVKLDDKVEIKEIKDPISFKKS